MGARATEKGKTCPGETAVNQGGKAAEETTGIVRVKEASASLPHTVAKAIPRARRTKNVEGIFTGRGMETGRAV